MARTTTKQQQQQQQPTQPDLQQQIAQLQALLAIASAGTASTTRLASDKPMVGIRNVSDNTIGEPGKFGEPDLHLHADLGEHDPASVTSISYAWWRELRKGKLVRDGLIVRDDSVLGTGFVAAPEDKAEEIPVEADINTILDPQDWIESRTEAQLRADLARLTSDSSLRRIRRAVDVKLKALEESYGDDVPNKAAQAVDDLPMVYKFVDEYTTKRLERPEDFKPKK